MDIPKWTFQNKNNNQSQRIEIILFALHKKTEKSLEQGEKKSDKPTQTDFQKLRKSKDKFFEKSR